MSKKVLVPVADGSEEIEAVCVIDVLRRAGADVTVASVGHDLHVTASRGVRIVADRRLDDCVGEVFDLIALPGGMPGAENLAKSTVLMDLLKIHKSEGRLYGAICAAPAVALAPHGLLGGKAATAHPNFLDRLSEADATIRPSRDRVVVDGRCVTSRGPGTAIEFALKLVELLYGPEKAAEVAGSMVVADAAG